VARELYNPLALQCFIPSRDLVYPHTNPYHRSIMDSKQLKREEKAISKEAKADDRQLKSAQKYWNKDKKKETKLLKQQSKAEDEHRKAIQVCSDHVKRCYVQVI